MGPSHPHHQLHSHQPPNFHTRNQVYHPGWIHSNLCQQTHNSLLVICTLFQKKVRSSVQNCTKLCFVCVACIGNLWYCLLPNIFSSFSWDWLKVSLFEKCCSLLKFLSTAVLSRRVLCWSRQDHKIVEKVRTSQSQSVPPFSAQILLWATFSFRKWRKVHH